MKLKELEIQADKPFDLCRLGREKYAKVLTSIVGSYSDGFVLALNNEWGAGKTTFLKMWQAQLEQEEFTTVYFNAWENDFDNKPLVALLGELKSLVGPGENKVFDSLVQKGAVMAKAVIPALIKAILKNKTGIEDFGELMSKIAEGSLNIFKEEVDNYTSKKAGLKDFKVKLEEFVSKNKGGKPLIFIVDELDRCRPNYAVEVLEQIKHFFSVPGIVFVLAIDKEQLGHAVRGVYGSEQINADEYLRRFIDLEYHLPAPDTKKFCAFLLEAYDFQSFFRNENRISDSYYDEDSSRFYQFIVNLLEKNDLNLRQQEKLFAKARLVLRSFKIDHNMYPELLVTLLFIQEFKSDFFQKLINSKIEVGAMLDEFYEIIKSSITPFNKETVIEVEAQLLMFYWFQYNQVMAAKFINGSLSGVSSKISDDKTAFLELAKRYNEGVKLDYLWKKITLVDKVLD